MNKLCSHCKIKKNKSEFNKGTGRFGLINWCKECCKKYWQTPKRIEIMKQRRKTKEYKIFMQNYRKSLKGIYSYIKGSAKARNINFKLKENDFINWYKKQKRICIYCRRIEKQVIKDRKGRIYRLTIDRMNNSFGYIINNLILCCHKCNEIKGSIFTYDEMRKIGNVLSKIYKKNYND